MADPLIGRKIGDYELRAPLGQGGMAIVYLAYQANLQREVAIKIVSALIAQEPTFLERFTREVALVARLQHAHIVPVFDYGTTDDGLTYLAMRHIQGGSLGERMAKGPLTTAQINKWFGQIAEALEYAHQQNVIHRDIKPSNILIDSSENAYLVDFGLARVLDSDKGGNTTPLTRSSTFMGTPLYMSPEQIEQRPIDKRSDLYNLGVVLWEMVMGAPPFTDESTFRVMQMHLTDAPPSPRKLRPDLSAEVEAVLIQTIRKSPDQRFQSAGAMARAFNAASSGLSTGVYAAVHAEPTPTEVIRTRAPTMPIRPQPSPILLVALLFLLLGGGGLAVLTATGSLRSRPTATFQPTPTLTPGVVVRPKTGTVADLALSAAELSLAPLIFKDSFLGVVACSLSSDYHASYAAAARSRAQELGIPVQVEDSAEQPDKQPVLINSFVAKGARGIVLCVLNADASREARTNAAAAKVAMAVNDDASTPGGVAFTITNESMGNAAGSFAAEFVRTNLNGKAVVMVLNYPDLPQIRVREEAMTNAFKAGAPEATVFAAYLGGTEENGEQAMRRALLEHPDINLILSINDAGAIGAVRVLRDQKKAFDQVSIVSIDAVNEARRLLRNGEYFRGLVDTSPVAVGRYSVDAIVKILAGGVVPEVIQLPLRVITKADADTTK